MLWSSVHLWRPSRLQSFRNSSINGINRGRNDDVVVVVVIVVVVVAVVCVDVSRFVFLLIAPALRFHICTHHGGSKISGIDHGTLCR